MSSFFLRPASSLLYTQARVRFAFSVFSPEVSITAAIVIATNVLVVLLLQVRHRYPDHAGGRRLELRRGHLGITYSGSSVFWLGPARRLSLRRPQRHADNSDLGECYAVCSYRCESSFLRDPCNVLACDCVQ